MQLVDLWYVNLDPFGPYSTVGPQSRGSCPCINTIRCEPFPEDGKGVRRRELAGIPCRPLTGRGGLAGVLEWVQPPKGGGYDRWARGGLRVVALGKRNTRRKSLVLTRL